MNFTFCAFSFLTVLDERNYVRSRVCDWRREKPLDDENTISMAFDTVNLLTDMEVLEPLYDSILVSISCRLWRLYKNLPKKIKKMGEMDELLEILTKTDRALLNDISTWHPRNEQKTCHHPQSKKENSERTCSRVEIGSNRISTEMMQSTCLGDADATLFSSEEERKKIAIPVGT